MQAQRWARISEVFHAADALPAEQREAYLETACQGDGEFLKEVRRMLDNAGGAAERLEAAVAAVRPAEIPEDDVDDLPAQAGPYRLVREIARGGMGSVWLAERAEGGFRQTVAIKFIKRGMDTGEILRRFRQERQILSLLNHPNIGRLLDGGATSDDRPYLVMEYIQGQPILDFCRSLPVPRILGLFRTVCAAVQYAHSNLVVHRDLKPANILIDAKGEVKLLDFGIAKLLEPGEDSVQTHTGIRAFTPAFASPEQRDGRPLTTATDVYSLGAVLQAILPAAHGSDLAAIVARATRAEPELRYLTVEQLSEDVLRYLNGRPVLARQGNLSYLVGKFLRRNKLTVGFAAASLVMMGAFLVSTWHQNRRTERERDRAENVTRFMRSLFAAADPERNQGNHLTLRHFLDDGAQRARTGIRDPETRAQTEETIAGAYFNLGLYEKASGMYQELIRYYGSEPSARLARALGYIAEADSARGRRDDGERWGTRAVSTARAITPRDDATLALVLQSRCVQLQQDTRFGPAAAACRDAAATAARSSLPPADRARILVSLGLVLKEESKFQEAERVFQDAMQLAHAPSDEMNSASAQVLSEMATLYFRQGRFAEAETALRRAVEFKRKLYPEGNLDMARTLNNLASAVATFLRTEEATRIFEEAHKLYRDALGPESTELASSLSNLAMVLKDGGGRERAATLMEQVLVMQARTIGAGKRPYAMSQLKLGSILIEQGEHARAYDVLDDALASLQRLTPVPAVETAYAKTLLAHSLLETGQPARAVTLAREGRARMQLLLKPDHWMMEYSGIVTSGALIRTGHGAEAREILEPILLTNEKKQAQGWRSTQARKYWAELQSRRK